jgi:hypothetical protein
MGTKIVFLISAIFLISVCHVNSVVIDSYAIHNTFYNATDKSVLLTQGKTKYEKSALETRITDTEDSEWSIYEVTHDSIEEADNAKKNLKVGEYVHLMRTLYGNIDGKLQAIRIRLNDVPYKVKESSLPIAKE